MIENETKAVQSLVEDGKCHSEDSDFEEQQDFMQNEAI